MTPAVGTRSCEMWLKWVLREPLWYSLSFSLSIFALPTAGCYAVLPCHKARVIWANI